VDDNSALSKFSVFPTVITSGIFNWSVSEEVDKSNINLTIYNIAGQLVKEVQGPNSEVNVSKLSSGLYFVKINSDLGSVIKKIIKN